MSIQNLRSTFGVNCHWCGLPMDFNEPHDRAESATVEHLNDATLGSVRKQKHRRLAHQICNRMRNEFRMQAERQFAQWVAGRKAACPLVAGRSEAAKAIAADGGDKALMDDF